MGFQCAANVESILDPPPRPYAITYVSTVFLFLALPRKSASISVACPKKNILTLNSPLAITLSYFLVSSKFLKSHQNLVKCLHLNLV